MRAVELWPRAAAVTAPPPPFRRRRLLDPQLATSYPSAILCRDKALVVNMEYIKCVITTSELTRGTCVPGH